MYLIEITRDVPANDLELPSDNLINAQHFIDQTAYGPDGWRLIEYQEYSGLDDFVLPNEPNAKFVLRDSRRGDIRERTYNTASGIRLAINQLDPSDGYLAFASWDGDGGAKRLEQRPARWRHEEAMGEGKTIHFGREIGQKPNEYNRLDQDRF